jgi:hypothetical protein
MGMGFYGNIDEPQNSIFKSQEMKEGNCDYARHLLDFDLHDKYLIAVAFRSLLCCSLRWPAFPMHLPTSK